MKNNFSSREVMIMIAFIILIVAILFFIESLLLSQVYFSYSGVTIREGDYRAIQKQFKDDPIVTVCSFETGNCIALGNIENLRELNKGRE